MGIVSRLVANKKLLAFPVLLLAVVIFVGLVKSRKRPVQLPPKERVTAVRFIPAPKLDAVPRAVGYGLVKPGQEWNAVAEMGGKVVEMHPDLKKGNVIAKGEVLIRIDPAESGFIRQRSEADIRQIQARINKLDQQERDTKRLIEAERGKLELSRADLERKRSLVEKNVLAKSELDQAEQSFLSQQNAVQNHLSTLNSLPAERQSLLAQLAAAKASTADARLDEERTVIRAPYDCRVAAANVELGQAVKVGEVVARLDSMVKAEVLAQVPVGALRNIMPVGWKRDESSSDVGVLRKPLQIHAKAKVRIGNDVLVWNGRVSRMSEEVDAGSRTLGVYVVVERPYIKAEDGVRPPLLKNMYAEVELFGEAIPGVVVVPRFALHGEYVYIADAENRLELRKVGVLMTQGDFVILSSGVQDGERLVLSDVVPAVNGMLLDPVEDAGALDILRKQAEGAGDVS